MALDQAQQTNKMDASVSSSYPQRPGEPDCVYYMRTGLCGYGSRCRFNHPPSRKLSNGSVRNKDDLSDGNEQPDVKEVNKEDLPERLGQPDCQYYLKTGACKYGAACKFHHPWERPASTKGDVQLNLFGLPMRLGEKECAYYTRTGSCKFGVNCKFHHPQPGTVGGTMLQIPSPQMYPYSGYPTLDSVPYNRNTPTWFVARPYIPGFQVSPPVNYTPVIFPPPWTPIKGPVSPVTPLDGADHSPNGESIFSAGSQTEDVISTPSKNSRSPRSPREDEFPEREGQPECQYYLKTGDCKFGASCKFHHPKDRAPLLTTLSVIGLPLRPGQPECSFYLRYGICKFGPVCKFHHPVVMSIYNAYAASLYGLNGFTGKVASPTATGASSPEVPHTMCNGTDISSKISSCNADTTSSAPKQNEDHKS